MAEERLLRVTGVLMRARGGLEEVGALPAGTIEMQAPFFKERGLDLSGFIVGH